MQRNLSGCWKKPAVLWMTVLLIGFGYANGFAYYAGLTPLEKLKPEARYYNSTFAPLPDEVEEAFSNGPISSDQVLDIEDINDLLNPGYLEVENGYILNADGTGFVAVRTDFPDATGDMIHWWFWWHAYRNVRYKIWCPGDHYAISFHNEGQMNNPFLSYEQRYLNNPQYPVEDTGTGIRWLSIRFVPPEDFGFDTSKFNEMGIEAVICGVVGDRIAGLTINHTYMVHLFRRTADGLELRSRFWVGKALKSEALRKLMITENIVKKLGLHCSTEYNHLSEFLPDIYAEFK
jgi:hypothetical protein